MKCDVLWALLSILLSAYPIVTSAQENLVPAESNLTVIPINRAAPEVQEFEAAERAFELRDLAKTAPVISMSELGDNGRVSRAAEGLERSTDSVLLTLRRLRSGDAGANGFFVAIDVPGAVRRTLRDGGLGMQIKALALDADTSQRSLASAEERTTFAPEGQGWFSTNYPELNTNLRCDWTFDARLQQVLIDNDKKAREAELEADYRAGSMGADGAATTVEELVPDQSDGDPEQGMERQFMIAGRPCLLTYMCDNREIECSTDVVDLLVESTVLISLGDDK